LGSAAELAHWQDRDRNQKIMHGADGLDKLRAWVDEGRMPNSSTADDDSARQSVALLQCREAEGRSAVGTRDELLIAHTATHRASGWTGQRVCSSRRVLGSSGVAILASVVVQLFRTARKRNASVWESARRRRISLDADKPNEHALASSECDDEDHRQATGRYAALVSTFT